MIDSGASHSFINSKLVEECKLKTDVKTPMVVTLANGLTVQSDLVVSVPVRFAPCFECIVECRVVDGLSHPLVFGMQWLKEYNP